MALRRFIMEGTTTDQPSAGVADAYWNTTTGQWEYSNGAAWTGRHRFSVYRNATQSINSGAWTAVQFNNEVYDVGGVFNTGTYIFQPVRNGLWHIGWSIGFSDPIADQAAVATALYIGGAAAVRGTSGNASGNEYPQLVGGYDVPLITTDQVQVYVYHAHGAARNLTNTIAQMRWWGHELR